MKTIYTHTKAKGFRKDPVSNSKQYKNMKPFFFANYVDSMIVVMPQHVMLMYARLSPNHLPYHMHPHARMWLLSCFRHRLQVVTSRNIIESLQLASRACSTQVRPALLSTILSVSFLATVSEETVDNRNDCGVNHADQSNRHENHIPDSRPSALRNPLVVQECRVNIHERHACETAD